MPTSMSRDLFDPPLVVKHASGHSPAREIINFGVAKKKLLSTQVFGASVDE